MMLEPEQRNVLDEHYERFFGSAPTIVMHEMVSQIVHIDVNIFPPTAERPYMTLATSGMSALPMQVPSDAGRYNRAELLLYLDHDWDFGSPIGQLPISILQKLARYPHLAKTWVSEGHTVEGSQRPLIPGSLLTDLYLS